MPAKKRLKKRGAKKRQRMLIPEAPEEKNPEDFGDYKLGDQLGRGAFGSVYQGLDTSTGALVAIKTIQLDRGSSLEGVQSEIKMMSALNNEHIIKYIGSHKTQDFLYIVMEYAEGGSLQHIQKKFTNFNEQLAAHYIHQVLIGLQYLHSQSIIHRDIKAANILLSNNVAKLSDFGISVNLNEGPKAEADFQCSPYWAAPEVINMEAITEKCDIWSLGITAIEMFAGQPPYFDMPPIPAMFKIAQSQETPLPENISSEFKDFLLKCLKRDVSFRPSTDELLNHQWITRTNLKPRNELSMAKEIQKLKDTSPKQDTNLDIFKESSDDDNLFDSNDGGAALTTKSQQKAKSLDDFAETSSDDFNDSLFTARVSNQTSARLELIKDEGPKTLEDFAEDDQDSDDFGEAFETLPSNFLNVQLPQTPRNRLSISLPSGDSDEDDDMFSNDGGTLQFASVDPRKNIEKLDDIFGEDEDAGLEEQERQNQIMKNTIAMMDKLPELSHQSHNEAAIIETCNTIMKNFKNEDSLRTNLSDFHGVIPIVEIMQTRNQFLLEHAMPFIIEAVTDQADTQNMLCLLGVLPYLFDYCYDPQYSASIQEMSLTILHNLCISKKKPLQMFISAGGLLMLSKILAGFTHKERPAITKLVLEIIDAVFSFHCSTPRSCFASIMAQSNIIILLGQRFVEISKDDPSMKILCNILEVFSNADTKVKIMMTDPKFVDDIFTKAKYKWTQMPSSKNVTKGLAESKNNQGTNKLQSNNSVTDVEVVASTSGLNDFDLLTIMRTFNNLAMDKAVVQLLWRTSLVDNLLQYCKVDRHPQMNPMLSTCFSALFHLSRVLSSENVPKIAPLIPMLVYIITNDLQLKELATTLFLEFINNHSNDKQMRLRLEQSNGVETLFYLFERSPHKETIISQFDNWAYSQNMVIEKSLISHIDKFSDIIIEILKTDNFSNQTIVMDKLIQICDKCPKLKVILGYSKLFKFICRKILTENLSTAPDLRKALISLVLIFYQYSENPKKTIVSYRIDRVGKKLLKDSSLPVRTIAIQLMQSVASNYIF